QVRGKKPCIRLLTCHLNDGIVAGKSGLEKPGASYRNRNAGVGAVCCACLGCSYHSVFASGRSTKSGKHHACLRSAGGCVRQRPAGGSRGGRVQRPGGEGGRKMAGCTA